MEGLVYVALGTIHLHTLLFSLREVYENMKQNILSFFSFQRQRVEAGWVSGKKCLAN